jgi:uncharacterized protein (TIGR03435 family)
MKPTFTALALLALLPGALLAQSAALPPAFEVAKVQASPRVPPGIIYTDGGGLHGDRYSLRQATMVDLIGAAYRVEVDNVQGGPSWLERDRFDIFAKAPPNTPPATLLLMLKSVRAAEFHSRP